MRHRTCASSGSGGAGQTCRPKILSLLPTYVSSSLEHFLEGWELQHERGGQMEDTPVAPLNPVAPVGPASPGGYQTG